VTFVISGPAHDAISFIRGRNVYMFYLWIIAGAAIGGVLGWLFDRRILKRDPEAEKNQDITPT
jgi:hypothetical protein